MATETAPPETDEALLAANQRLHERRASRSSSPDEPQSSEREIACGTCLKRGIDPPAQIQQRKLAEFGGMWWPRQCEACNADMVERDALVEKELERRRVRDAAELEQHQLEESGLPPIYRRRKRGMSDLDAGPNTDGYRAARRVCANLVTGNLVDGNGTPIPWVYLYGPNGTHKSTLACCTALELMRLGKRVRYILWPEALDDLRGLNRDDASESVSQFIRRLVEVPHLAVDEIGLGTPTPFAAEKLFLVIERRYQEDSAADAGERSMIFTSNRSASELAGTFAHIDDGLGGRRLARRISDMATEINIMATETDVTS